MSIQIHDTTVSLTLNVSEIDAAIRQLREIRNQAREAKRAVEGRKKAGPKVKLIEAERAASAAASKTVYRERKKAERHSAISLKPPKTRKRSTKSAA